MDKQEEWARDLEYERARARVEGRAEGKAEGKAEGRAEGRAEGKAEGRAEGIVQSLVSLGIPKDTTLKLLQDQLNVSFEEAKELFNKYAK